MVNVGYGKQFRQLDPILVARVEAVLDRIYTLTTQEFIDIVKHDVGCIQIITAEQLYKRMATEPNLLVINVLSERWYRDCHIKGSINIPLKDLIYRIKNIDLDRPIVVYCALDACNGGQKAFILLRALGYTNVVDYHDGVKDWYQHGYPVEGPCAESYLHEEYVHRGICIAEDAL
jgi:rhodanese-related sulfurtransferase